MRLDRAKANARLKKSDSSRALSGHGAIETELRASKKQLRTTSVIRDVAKRKQMEKSLRKSEHVHKAMADSLSRAIAEKDRLLRELRNREQMYREIYNATSETIAVEDTLTGSFVEVNEPMVRMYGYSSKEELMARSIGDLSEAIPPYTQENALRLHALVMAGSPQVFEWMAKKKNGELFNVEVSLSCSPIRGENRILAVVRDITERKRAETALREAHDNLDRKVKERTASLRALATQLVQAEENERQRIANILHEDLQQMLTGTRLMLRDLRERHPKEDAKHLVDRVMSTLEAATQLTRSLCCDLRPPMLYEAGLVAALKWLADDMKKKFGLAVQVRADESCEPESKELRVFIFEAVRALLLNVVKHADVKRAQATLSVTEGNRIHVQVKDRGKGFDALPGTPSGFGLFSLRERTESFGGELNIRSAPGKGTCVTLALPKP